MSETSQAAEDRELEATFWTLYRDYFDRAERKRRWSVRDDIPWDQCNPQPGSANRQCSRIILRRGIVLARLHLQDPADGPLQSGPLMVLRELGL